MAATHEKSAECLLRFSLRKCRATFRERTMTLRDDDHLRPTCRQRRVIADISGHLRVKLRFAHPASSAMRRQSRNRAERIRQLAPLGVPRLKRIASVATRARRHGPPRRR